MVTARYVLTVVTVALGASTQFYTYGVINPSQELLEEWINRTYYHRNGYGMSSMTLSVYWSFVVSSVAIGAFVGSLLTRRLAETCGRRNGLIANGIVNVFGALFEGIAKGTKSPELLILGRFILGANMGLTSGLVPMYLMEITPVRYRGAAGTVHQVAVAFSDWFSLLLGLPAVLGGEHLWPLAVAFPGLPALLLCIILPLCPESPRYTLISLGKRQEAYKAVRALVGEKHAKATFDSLIKEAALTPENANTSVSDLFRRKSLRTPLLISVGVMIAQQFTGCTAVFAYSTDMFIKAKLSKETARWSTLGIGIAYFLCACPSPYLIERLGRRFLSLFQLTGCLIALILLSVFTWLQNDFGQEWASYGSIFALVAYMCVYGVGSPIPWLITGELFSQEYRSAAVTMSTFVAWFWAFVISTSYLPFQQLVGVSFSYLPFIIGLVLSIIFMAFLLPETKNKSIEEIVNEFRSRSRTISRSFVVRRHLNTTTQPELTRLMEESDEESNGYGAAESVSANRPSVTQDD